MPPRTCNANTAPRNAVKKEFEKITTQDFVCIAQTVTKEITNTKDAEVHADASAPLATPFTTLFSRLAT